MLSLKDIACNPLLAPFEFPNHDFGFTGYINFLEPAIIISPKPQRKGISDVFHSLNFTICPRKESETWLGQAPI